MNIPTILLMAMIQVESHGDNKAIGDNNKAYGCLQIQQAYIDDVNKVYGTKYTIYHAFERVLAVDITCKYLKFYGDYYERHEGKKATFEILARIHNGGPYGWLNPKTAKYWKKVKLEMEADK